MTFYCPFLKALADFPEHMDLEDWLHLADVMTSFPATIVHQLFNWDTEEGEGL